MPILEGSHTQRAAGRGVRYRVDYHVVGNVVNYKATFPDTPGAAPMEGQFDFDPSKIDAAAAVAAFMNNHIGKADFDVAP